MKFINHYVQKIKEHEARRASYNEREAYWIEFFKNNPQYLDR